MILTRLIFIVDPLKGPSECHTVDIGFYSEVQRRLLAKAINDEAFFPPEQPSPGIEVRFPALAAMNLDQDALTINGKPVDGKTMSQIVELSEFIQVLDHDTGTRVRAFVTFPE